MDDYEIGYKKPPQHTRFEKGVSGNPAGRPKGKRKSLAQKVEDELRVKITVQENGQQKTITKEEAMIKTLVNKAIKGETRAISIITKQRIEHDREFGVEEKPVRCGVLLAPARVPQDVWEREVGARQAPYRGSNPALPPADNNQGKTGGGIDDDI